MPKIWLRPVFISGDAQPKGGRHPEHGTEHRQHVGGMAPEAVDAIAKNGIEHGADGQRQLAPVAEEGQRQADDHIDGPGCRPQWKKVKRMAIWAASGVMPSGDEGLFLQVIHGSRRCSRTPGLCPCSALNSMENQAK